MTLPQRFGNWLAPFLIRLLYGYRFTDLGLFRAIRWEKLIALDMRDPNYGWTVEMQIKQPGKVFDAPKFRFDTGNAPPEKARYPVR